ncbi:MAG: hypothetical protein FWD61_00965 [Phycisphaerales bacterium]|nr:hypothetical protein [Phycisphaerales bacterium]
MTQVAATPSSDPPSPAGTGGGPAPFPGTIHLNAFQVLMRRWTHLHPYNAGQVMEVTGEPNRERWKRAAESVIWEMGLGVPRFDDEETQVHFAPATEVVIHQSEQDIESFFNEELNRPFAAGDMSVRFCVLPGRCGTVRDATSEFDDLPHDQRPSPALPCGAPPSKAVSHYFALVYDHWIGDSRAMRELMQRIFQRYQYPDKTPANGGLPPLKLDAPDFKSMFRRHVGRLTRWAAVRESIKNTWRQRNGFRINIGKPLNFNSRFLYRELPKGLIDKVHRVAKSNQASVNDAFIAVLAQTMGEFTAEKRAKRRHKAFHFRRDQMGVGTIVDIRDASAKPLDGIFNLYLSSYTVLLNKPEHRPVAELLHEVAATTAKVKKTFGTVRGFWALVMARFWTDRLKKWPRHQAQLLHKAVPLVAGISNVNMTKSWADQPREGGGAVEVPQVLDYLRISPTGPLAPLVFTLTTIQDRLSLCMTYRTIAFSDAGAMKILEDFVRRLSAI